MAHQVSWTGGMSWGEDMIERWLLLMCMIKHIMATLPRHQMLNMLLVCLSSKFPSWALMGRVDHLANHSGLPVLDLGSWLGIRFLGILSRLRHCIAWQSQCAPEAGT